MQLLEQALSGQDVEVASQAAGTLWSLCVDNTPNVKSILATSGTIRALIRLLSVRTYTWEYHVMDHADKVCLVFT